MKFHRISLRDYRGIRSCVIEPRESGVTVIEGDNEIGKSSIAEALWLIFEQHDDSSSQLVKSLRPADRDAATEIEVEVSSGPYRFIFFKRFHRGPRTELKVLAPQREILAGREADNRANDILRETIDVSLWKALRSQQGMQDSLEPPAAGQHRSLLGALEIAAGPLMGGEREQAVFAAAQAEYEKYFTPSGREKASGDGQSAPKLRSAEIAAIADVDRITARIREMEAKAQRSAELEARLNSLARELEAATALREELEGQDRRRQDASAAVERLRAELQAREAEARALVNDAEHRERAVAALEPRRAELAAEESHLATDAPELERLQGARAAAAEALERAASERTEAQGVLAKAEELVQLSGRQLQVDQMAERLERLERLEPEAARLAEWLANCRVTSPVLAELEDLDKRLAVLIGRRDAEAAAVEITAEEAATITVNNQEVALDKGQTRRGRVRVETAMAFPGGINVVIRPGSAARETEAQAKAAEDALKSLLDRAGVADLAAAREALNERAAIEERRKQFAAQVQNDLRDLTSARELGDKLERERAAIAGVLREAGLEAIPSVAEAKSAREQAAAALVVRESAVAAAGENHEAAREALANFERQVDGRAARISAMRGELERAEEELARLRDRIPDGGLTEAISTASAARSSAEASLAEAVAGLAALEDVTQPLRDAAAACDRLARAWSEASREEAGIRALLEDAGAAGLHGQLVEAEQRLTEASEELASFSRRAAAARLLFETLRARRDEARENYAGPLKACIESLGRRIYNDSFGIELSEDLRLVRRSLDGITLDLPQISVGAREQLSVLTRLACAALVSAEGGAPLVLDDILGWADPKRLEALGPVLAEAAGESQVFLFTCSPERFATVSPARVITLPSGRITERNADGSARPEVQARRVTTPVTVAAAVAGRPPQGSFDLFSG